jgi:UDP-N-acetyl-D-glucosamine/UDP-N-acetyl-D-galactosamine dehydrogenase
LINKNKIGIIGLGYVGLPLAVEFGKKFDVVGYDRDCSRIEKLKNFIDDTNEVSERDIEKAVGLNVTSQKSDLKLCNFFVICVPTPIDSYKIPDLTYLQAASELVGSMLKAEDIVVYESTVYPGCTREVCIPILQKTSNLKLNNDFFCGYSPERINPGDKHKRITDIVKVTSGSNSTAAKKINEVYSEIISAGTHMAPSIEVAEAAKVIENIQRDVNIALVNELSLLFEKLDLETGAILEAASTKWNFINFRPGLVGGHCIGIDPYYLEYRSRQSGYHPQLISTSRKINDG